MKKLISLCLALALSLSLCLMSASAYSPAQLNSADALYTLGLFLGTGESYELNANLTRAEGITMLVRMLGKEAEAKSGSYQHPFTDVPDWAEPYVAYAYTAKLTNGVSETAFEGDSEMTNAQFLTLVLRALGYSDSGSNPAFTWDKPFTLAKSIGLCKNSVAYTKFFRAHAATAFWNALGIQVNGRTDHLTLAEVLIAQNVFTAEAYQTAAAVAKDGLPAGAKSGETNPRHDPIWEEYNAMTAEEQNAFFKSFASPTEYSGWRQVAYYTYDAERDVIRIEGNAVDFSDYFKNAK